MACFLGGSHKRSCAQEKGQVRSKKLHSSLTAVKPKYGEINNKPHNAAAVCLFIAWYQILGSGQCTVWSCRTLQGHLTESNIRKGLLEKCKAVGKWQTDEILRRVSH